MNSLKKLFNSVCGASSFHGFSELRKLFIMCFCIGYSGALIRKDNETGPFRAFNVSLSGLLKNKYYSKFHFIFFVIFSFFLVETSIQADEVEFFDQGFGDFSEELETAKEEGKSGVFIFFEMDECPFCHRMKTTVLNQPEVVSFYKKHFKIFMINIDGDVEMTDFQGNVTTQKEFSFKQQRVRATPVFAFFDLSGKRVVKYTGPTSSVEEFIWLGEFMLNGGYKKSSFTRYKRNRRKNG